MSYLPPDKSTHFFNNISEICDTIEYVQYRKNYNVLNAPFVFDIEASSFYNEDNEKRCTMYAFVFGINGRCVRGRTWQDFFDIINYVVKRYDITPKKRVIIYVHNLSYEFQWIKDYFQWEKVFCNDERKPIYALTKQGIEFRCSYLLSGYSLAVLGKNLLKYKVEKKVGDLDYKLIRHSETPLTNVEWGYILNDGLVVMSHIQEEIERLGDISCIPLTKTGYVRELCREKCFSGQEKFMFSNMMKTLVINDDDYFQLKRAYCGGFTHANIHYVDRVLECIDSFDFSSSYPAVMLSERYPMSKPYKYTIKSDDDFVDMINRFCCLFDVEFINIVSTCSYENYISISKCYEQETALVNNGRLVEADRIKLTITEQDFFIINELYKWDEMRVSNFKYFYRDFLPKDFVLTILELYKNKTELKGVEGKEVEYMVQKNMINSCYGMCVTDPCKDDIYYNEKGWHTEEVNVSTVLEKYNKNGRRFLYYPWGVWVTAYARTNLFNGIMEFGDDYVYSDTDSIKVKNADKHKEYFEQYNKNITNKVYQCLNRYEIPLSMAHPKTKDGVEKPIGVWDYEGQYSRFKTLGAKRYLTEKNDKISITIAGVAKSNGTEYLKYKYKTNDAIFENFNEGIIFPANYDDNGVEKNGSGKLCHTYMDFNMEGDIIDYMGKKYHYKEASGVHLENTDYELSFESEFKKLLCGIKGEHII